MKEKSPITYYFELSLIHVIMLSLEGSVINAKGHEDEARRGTIFSRLEAQVYIYIALGLAKDPRLVPEIGLYSCICVYDDHFQLQH